MMIFIAVIFKATRLWNKTIFASVYFLIFLILACGGLFALIFGSEYPTVEQVKSGISTFIDGMKGEVIQSSESETVDILEDTGFLFEETGEVLGISLSGDSLLSGEQNS